MKRAMVCGAFLVAGVSGPAMAIDCSNGTLLNQNQLPGALTNNTVCAKSGGDSWQEYHQSGGALIDYKKGQNDPIDPTKQVGTWSIVGTGSNTRVHYDYGSGGVYEYSVHLNGGIYTLCGVGSAPTLDVTIMPGQGSCGY